MSVEEAVPLVQQAIFAVGWVAMFAGFLIGLLVRPHLGYCLWLFYRWYRRKFWSVRK